MRELKQLLQEELKNAGIAAKAAGQWRLGGLIEENCVFIQLQQASVTQGGMYGYLGQDTQGNEQYGMALNVKFALVLLSPSAAGGEGAEAFAEEVLNTLMASVSVLGIQDMVCAQAEYDSLRDCFKQEIVVSNQVMAYGVKTEAGITLERFCVQAQMQ